MTTIHASGYMLEVDYADQVLTARATTKMSRLALLGHNPGDTVTLHRTQIATMTLKRANAWVNGSLDLRTGDGRRYQLHFKNKQTADFDALHDALVADTPAEPERTEDAPHEPAQQHGVTYPAQSVASAVATDAAAQIRSLADLHAAGILTDDEYASKKAEILARM